MKTQACSLIVVLLLSAISQNKDAESKNEKFDVLRFHLSGVCCQCLESWSTLPFMSHKSWVFSGNPWLACEDTSHLIVYPVPRFSLSLQQTRFSRQGPVHSGTTATTAIAILVASMTLGPSSRRVLLLLELLSLSWVTTVRVGDGMWEVRLAAVHPRLVHTNFELTGSGDRCAAAAMVILVEGV